MVPILPVLTPPSTSSQIGWPPAAWCAAHGLAEMVAFKQFDHLKVTMGGEEAFLRGVFEHMGIFGHARTD